MTHIAKLYKLATCATMLAAGVLTAPAADSVSYINEGSSTVWWGTGKTETYDVAARLDAGFVGARIISVTFRAASDPEVSGFSIWLSKNLSLDSDKKNVPDVMSADVEVKNGKVSLTLPEPYTIDDEGIYIGYSFTVASRETQVQKQPVAVALGTDNGHHGLYVHSTRTYSKWTENAAGESAFLPFEVEFNGLPEYSVALSIPAELNAAVGKETVFDATLTGYGMSGVSSVDIEWEGAGHGGKINMNLPEPLPALYGAAVPLKITLPSLAETGNYNLNMKIAAADGHANSYAGGDASSALNVWEWIPKRRPMLEEYTGTQCGFCPRGAIGLEKMTALHGDDFVGVAYHHADIMSILPPEKYPNPAPAQPVAWIDRTIKTDPYFGNLPITSKTFGIDDIWTQAATKFTPADLSLSCRWTDDSRTMIKADAKAVFVKGFDKCDFRLSYILIADGLTGESTDWAQGNYYSGQTDSWPDDFESLVKAGNLIVGLKYDHVAIFSPAPGGIEGSVPSRIGAGETVPHSQTLSLADALNLDKKPLAQEGATYSVVAVLTDASTGETINSAKARPDDGASIYDVVYREPVAIEYYDLLGRPLQASPSAGIYVEVCRYPDGRRIARKTAAMK